MKQMLKEIFTWGGEVDGMLCDGVDMPYSREGLSQEALDSIAAAEEKARQEEEAKGEKSELLPGDKADPLAPWNESDIDTLSQLGPDDAPAALEDATPKIRSLNSAESDDK